MKSRVNVFPGILFIFAWILVTSLSSAQGSEWVTADRIGNPNASTTIVMSVSFDYSPQYDVEARRQYLRERFEQWTRRHPDVKVEFNIVSGDPPEWHARLLEQVARGNAPDVAQLDGQLVPLFYRWLQPIGQYLTPNEINDWFEWARDAAMIDPDGQLKSLWFTTNTVGLWYRRDLIPEPPKTWDELLEVAQKLKDEHGYRDGLLAIGFGEQIPYGAVLPSFYALGGRLVDENGRPIFGEGASRQALIETFQAWREAVDRGIVPRRVVDIQETGDLIAEAAADAAPMLIGGSWLLSGLKEVTDIEKWDFAPLPHKNGIRAQVVGGFNWGVFTTDPRKQALAVDLVLYVYAGREGMAGWSEAGGYSPLRHSVYRDFTTFNLDRFHRRFAEALEYGRTRPGVEAYPVISQAIQDAFQQVILGTRTPEQAVDDAWRFVQLETM